LIDMTKEKYFSVHNDFKTGFFFKLLLFLGIFLLIVTVFFKIGSLVIGGGGSSVVGQIYEFSQTTYPNTILAFSIILLGVSAILYFFHYQFAKLAKIADEIENEENLETSEEK
jgi:uncharacterized membrane protein